MRIREATTADIEAIITMSINFLVSTPFGEIAQATPEGLGKLTAKVLEVGVIFLAELDGKPIGMLALVPAINLLGGFPYADEQAWWVEPEHRNGRAGYYLLRSAEEWTRQNGLSMLKMVAPAKTAVGAFYERRGYVEVETSYLKTFELEEADGAVRVREQQKQGASSGSDEAAGDRAGADAGGEPDASAIRHAKLERRGSPGDAGGQPPPP